MFDGLLGALKLLNPLALPDRSARVGRERPTSKHHGSTKRPMTVVRRERRAANKVAKASRKRNRRG